MVIPSHVLEDLADELAKATGASVGYSSQAVMCLRGGNSAPYTDVLKRTREKFGDILKEYNIVWLADRSRFEELKPIIAFYGDYIISILLARQFGGATTSVCGWLMYNRDYKSNHYGYKGDEAPEMMDVVSFVEQKYNSY